MRYSSFSAFILQLSLLHNEESERLYSNEEETERWKEYEYSNVYYTKKRSKNEGREEEQEGRFAFFVNDDHILLFKR